MLLARQLKLLNPRRTVVVSCGLALLLFAVYHFLLYGLLGVVQSAGGNHLVPSEPPRVKSESLREIIPQLFAPIKHPDFTSNFVDPTGLVYSHNNSIWTRSLGKELLILDVDTRYPEPMFDPKVRVDWENLDNLVTNAVFNHYLYATIHGYEYKFYRPEQVENHTATWPKVHSIFNLLPDYKFVVFLDGDASFRHLQLPFEWLLNRWNVTSRTSFAMARDPLDPDCNLCDSNGVAMMNTGFVIAQNLPYTNDIFDAWMKCTSAGTKYKDCEHWKDNWAHEQAVFSEYLRYDYNPDGDNIREIECGEANGFPGHMWYDPVDCNGKFVRHHTFDKGMTKTTTANSVMQAFIDIMKADFSKQGNVMVISEADHGNTPSEAQQQPGEAEAQVRSLETKRIIHDAVRRQ